MSDGQIFYLVFLALYLAECVIWLPPKALAVLSWRASRWIVRRPSSNFGNARRGALLAFPLPPLGTVFGTEAFPVALTKDGITSLTLDNPNPGGRAWQPLRSLAWDDLKEVSRHGGKLSINGRKFVTTASPQKADRLARLLMRLKACPSAEREALIRREIRSSLNPNRPRRLARFFLEKTSGLRWSANSLFAVSFLVVPFAYWLLRDSWQFFVILAAGWFLMLQISIEYFCLHRRFFPQLTEDRVQYLLLSILVPQFAMRALDDLSKGLLAASHPLAVLQTSLTKSDFNHAGGAICRDLHHPIPVGDLEAETPRATTIAHDFHHRILLPEIESWITRSHIDPATLEHHPLEPVAVASCPRCAASFIQPVQTCPDCQGIPTRKLEITTEE